jgi:prepilin-type N-terminal cleavage/methylation domain-containing protein
LPYKIKIFFKKCLRIILHGITYMQGKNLTIILGGCTMKLKNRKGFTLIELIVVIAILGVLAMLVVPKLSGFKASADNRVNEVNAKLLSNVAQMYAATNDGVYPSINNVPGNLGWTATFSSMDDANAFGLLSEGVVMQPVGSSSVFTYDSLIGKVTAPSSSTGGGGPTTPSLASVVLTVNNPTSVSPTITLPTVNISGFTVTTWTATHTGSSNIVISGSTATFTREGWMGGTTENGTITLTGTWSSGTLTKTFAYTIPAETWNAPSVEVAQTGVTYTP